MASTQITVFTYHRMMRRWVGGEGKGRGGEEDGRDVRVVTKEGHTVFAGWHSRHDDCAHAFRILAQYWTVVG